MSWILIPPEQLIFFGKDLSQVFVLYYVVLLSHYLHMFVYTCTVEDKKSVSVFVL